MPPILHSIFFQICTQCQFRSSLLKSASNSAFYAMAVPHRKTSKLILCLVATPAFWVA